MLGMGLCTPVYDGDENLIMNALLGPMTFLWFKRKSDAHMAFYVKHLYKRSRFRYKKK